MWPGVSDQLNEKLRWEVCKHLAQRPGLQSRGLQMFGSFKKALVSDENVLEAVVQWFR
jgi:hypothetical protein